MAQLLVVCGPGKKGSLATFATTSRTVGHVAPSGAPATELNYSTVAAGRRQVRSEKKDSSPVSDWTCAIRRRSALVGHDASLVVSALVWKKFLFKHKLGRKKLLGHKPSWVVPVAKMALHI